MLVEAGKYSLRGGSLRMNLARNVCFSIKVCIGFQGTALPHS